MKRILLAVVACTCWAIAVAAPPEFAGADAIPYHQEVPVQTSPVVNTLLCHFSVPQGKILDVEKVAGYVRYGPVVAVLFNDAARTGANVRVPRVSEGVAGLFPIPIYYFEADGDFFASDSDAFLYEGSYYDIQLVIKTDGENDNTNGYCGVSGWLRDEPSI